MTEQELLFEALEEIEDFLFGSQFAAYQLKYGIKFTRVQYELEHAKDMLTKIYSEVIKRAENSSTN